MENKQKNWMKIIDYYNQLLLFNFQNKSKIYLLDKNTLESCRQFNGIDNSISN